MSDPRNLALAALLTFACADDPGGASVAKADSAAPQSDASAMDRAPSYTADGLLERVDDWDRWTFLGTSLDLSYSDVPAGQHFFATVFMETTAFDHFRETGSFREGTMTALVAYSASMSDPPAAAGQYPGERVAFEMSVKDSERSPDAAWSYYSFDGARASAAPHDRADCFDCHDEHARTDHVFSQFYPVLR